MKVVIAEKPSVAMDLGKGLGKIERHDGYIVASGYYITWAVGHLAEINEEVAPKQWRLDTLPILPENFSYKVTSDKINQFNVIKKLLTKATTVVIATDAGREGELIARLILDLAEYHGKIERFWTSEALSPEVVKKEFGKLKDGHDFDSLYYSALGRQHSDWLFGINLTRLATIKATDKSIWSIGRVQTPVLKIIVERELEIRNFKPKPYWVLKAEFIKDSKKYSGTLLNKEEKNSTSFFDKDKAEAILKEIEKELEGSISKVTKEEKKQKPPLLHSLTTLQREANQIYGYPAKQTLDLAQELYEAKKISYPRTDAQHLDEQKDTKELIKKVLTKLGKENLLDRVNTVGKNVFNTKKLTDHYAVIPQDLLTKKQLTDKLTEAHYNIYVLIARRLTGAFMPDYIYQTTTINTKVKGHIFISRGKIDAQLGWKELYKKDKNTDETTDKDDEQSLPDLKKDDIVEKSGQNLEKKETKPPEKYKESSVLGVMERLNLGTPATRASIIETLKSREYVVLEKKNLIPKEKGIQLIENLKDREFTDPEMTASWEHELDNIYKSKQGKEGYQEFLKKMKNLVKTEVEGLKVINLAESSPNRVIEKCEKCKDINETEKFFKCNKCESIVWKNFIGKNLTEKNAKDLLSGKEISLKALESKSGNKFDAKAKFNNGKVELIFNNDLKGDSIGKCSCEGDISELPKLYKCTKCESIVWKKFLEKDLTKEEAVALLNKQTIELKDLKSKAGKVFDAKAKFTNGKITLEFN